MSIDTWLNPIPVGWLDWTLTLSVCVLAIPVLIVFGPIVLALRAILKVSE